MILNLRLGLTIARLAAATVIIAGCAYYEMYTSLISLAVSSAVVLFFCWQMRHKTRLINEKLVSIESIVDEIGTSLCRIEKALDRDDHSQ